MKCLSGAEATDHFEDENDETITDEDHKKNLHSVEEYFKKAVEKYKDLGECWNGLQEKIQSCLEQATQHCNNFGVCSGKKDPAHDASDIMKTWHKIEHQLDKEKHKHMKAFLDEVEKCFLSDEHQGHAAPAHHGAE